jgi:hypothetical protein
VEPLEVIQLELVELLDRKEEILQPLDTQPLGVVEVVVGLPMVIPVVLVAARGGGRAVKRRLVALERLVKDLRAAMLVLVQKVAGVVLVVLVQLEPLD